MRYKLATARMVVAIELSDYMPNHAPTVEWGEKTAREELSKRLNNLADDFRENWGLDVSVNFE